MIEAYSVQHGRNVKVCKNCINELFRCERCGSYYIADEVESYDVETSDGTERWCENCYSNHSFTCDCCGEAVSEDYRRSDGNSTICEDCYNDHFATCHNCGRLIDTEDEEVYERGGYDYCEDCYEDAEVNDDRDHSCIRNHGSKLAPTFHYVEGGNVKETKEDSRQRLYMGTEVEMDKGGTNDANAKKIMEQTKERRAYIETDGSLNHGLEFITFPGTLEYYRNHFEWKNICKTAVRLGYLAHNTQTCGLHIHINKMYLGQNYEQTEDTIAKIILFVENNWEDIIKFSRRTKGRLEQWAKSYKQNNTSGIDSSVYSKKIQEIKDGKAKAMIYQMSSKDGDRYHAINVTNSRTVEFRFFRGTLNSNTIIASLEFVQLLTDICKHTSSYSVERASFKTIKRLAIKHQYNELVRYMNERNMYTEITEPTIEKIEENNEEDEKVCV